MRNQAVLAISLAMLFATNAPAAECQQERAIYGDRDGAYELAFEPVGSEAAAATHRFKVRAVKGDFVLDGHIMMADEVTRSIGMIMNACPGGDVTGEELAACTVWQGVIYPIDKSGVLSQAVPAEGSDAADRLLIAGFGPALRFSRAWEEAKLNIAPWDELTFKECAQ